MQRLLAVAATILLVAASTGTADVIQADRQKLSLTGAIQKALEGHQVNDVNVGGHVFHIHPISKHGAVNHPQGFAVNGTIQHRVKKGRNERIQYRITYRPGQANPTIDYQIDDDGPRFPSPQRKGWEGSLTEVLNNVSDTIFYAR